MQKYNSVLIVDDDPVAVFIIKRIIAKADLCHNVHAHQNPENALEFLEKECHAKRDCPEIMIVDINMPCIDGFEFLERFRKLDFEKKEHVMVIMLTTSSAERDIEESKKYNVRAFISKPLTSDKLLEAIRGAQMAT